MKLFTFMLLCLFACVLAGCGIHVYAPANLHQDIVYQTKPASFDTAKTVVYVSGGLGVHTDPAFLNDLLYAGEADVSVGHNFKNFNLAYGAFGTIGDYSNSSGQTDQPYYFTDKYFGVVGGRASANFYVNTGHADVRFFGVEVAYSHEFGDYAGYRKIISQSNLPNYYVSTRTDLLTGGITSEVTWRPYNPEIRHSIRFFLGETFGDNNYYNAQTGQPYNRDQITLNNIFFKASYAIQFKQFMAAIDAGSGVLLRFGYKF
jgi:hypothetical protein